MTEKSPESYSEVKISYLYLSCSNQAEVTEMPQSQGRQSPCSAKLGANELKNSPLAK